MDGTPVPAAADTPAQEHEAAPRTGSYRPRYELVAEQILQLIAKLALQPGDRMPTENDLAAQLGTSRTVVREAVKILSALGRVRARLPTGGRA